MINTILFVDDEPNILAAFKRQLRTQYSVETATSGTEGLSAIANLGPFAVIVSDLRMPGMDGIQFLAKAKEIAPDSVRILLTGHAEVGAAINAVNEGNIFRFLTKPCPPELLVKSLDAALEQYRLVTAERELLEKTLSNSVRLLTEILSLANPLAFSRALRIRRIVRHVAASMKLHTGWQYELAAMLSQTGCVVLPADILEKVYARSPLSKSEESLYASHPIIAHRLLANIPRLEAIAGMVRDQQRSYASYAAQPYSPATEEIDLGAQILKVALDYDRLVYGDLPHAEAISLLRSKPGEHNPDVLDALGEEAILKEDWTVKMVDVSAADVGMILDEAVHTKDGKLLLAKGQEISLAVLEGLQAIAKGVGIVEPFRVLVPKG